MKNKLISGLFIGLCVISLAVNIVAISEIGKLTRTVVPDGPYTVQMGDVFEDAGAEEQVLVQQVLEKMSEDGIALSDEDAQALIDYINEKVEAQILNYADTVLKQEITSQTNALLEEKYAEYNLSELTDTQIIQINEEIARELQSRIKAFQQSYVLTNDDINRILDAADIDYEMGLYLYQNGYLTDEQLEVFLNSWDYRENFQNYFNGAVSNAHLMNYADTTTMINNVRDSLYNNIKEINGDIDSIELTLEDVDNQLNSIYAEIGMGGVSTGSGSLTERITTLETELRRVNSMVIYDITTDGNTLNITTTTVGVKSGNVTQ